MVRVRMLPNNEVCVIDNGKSYIFSSVGRCSQEDAGNLTKYMSGAMELPIISLLSSNGKLNVGVFQNDNSVKVFDSDTDSMSGAMSLQLKGGFIRLLRRDGVSIKAGGESVRFNQLLFVYKQGTDLMSLIRESNIQEAKNV